MIHQLPMLDFENIDVIDIDAQGGMLLCTKRDSGYDSFYFSGQYLIDRAEMDKMHKQSYRMLDKKHVFQNPIYIADIKSTSVEEWGQLLSTRKIKLLYEPSMHVEVFRLNADFLMFATYRYKVVEEGSPPQWVQHSHRTNAYFCMKLGGKYVIRYEEGYIIPMEDELHVLDVNNDWWDVDYSDLVEIDAYEKDKYKGKYSLSMYHYSEKKRQDKVYLLTAMRTPSRILPQTYSNIYFGRNFIIARRNEDYIICNSVLEILAVGNVQAAVELYGFQSPNTSFVSAIIDGKHQWLSEDGICELPKLTWPEPLPFSHFGGYKLAIKGNQILLDSYKTQEDDTFVSQTLTCVTDGLESISFINGKTDTGRVAELGLYYLLRSELLIVSRKGKYGLASVDNIDADNKVMTLKYNLPIEYSKLEMVQWADENLPLPTDRWKMQNGGAVLFYEKDGLIGIYPHVSSPKYKAVEKVLTANRFLRYTLPDNREGWLDVIEGREIC